jgi:hypothetical protein
MMNSLKKCTFLFTVIITIAQTALAQTNNVEMADVMRSNGKIYVVMAVCLVILFGLIAYVIRIDRRLSKMEQQNKD